MAVCTCCPVANIRRELSSAIRLSKNQKSHIQHWIHGVLLLLSFFLHSTLTHFISVSVDLKCQPFWCFILLVFSVCLLLFLLCSAVSAYIHNCTRNVNKNVFGSTPKQDFTKEWNTTWSETWVLLVESGRILHECKWIFQFIGLALALEGATRGWHYFLFSTSLWQFVKLP